MTKSPKFDARAVYHAVRRALDSRRYASTEMQKAAIAALKLPRGSARFAEACRRAVIAARVPAPSSDPGARSAARRNLAIRVNERVAGKVRDEAARRGLPVAVDLARAGERTVRHAGETRVDGRRVVLLRAEGWADYGSRHRAARKSLAILGGWDDNGMWAVRVPGTMTSVREALDWLMPADVRAARAEGRRVLRQGDVWIVERARADAARQEALPANHFWDAATRTIRHPDHAAVEVPFPAAFIPQRTLAANGRGRTGGD